MLIKNLPAKNREYYQKMLKAIGALSRLFSENDIPYLEYRLAENLFCKAFSAKNVSRSDASVDAVFENVGIGIKTFQGNSAQKIAEFNRDRPQYADLSDEEKIKKIAKLRNERLKATKRIYELNEMIYHCIKRAKEKIVIHEYPMELIDLSQIKDIKKKKNIISFDDRKINYTFNLSKSVLMRKFDSSNPVFELDIKIMDDPFKVLEDTISSFIEAAKEAEPHPFIILPLYSMKEGTPYVPEKSGLNQWNAGGRERNYDEIYIRIPSWIHQKFPGFFPPRDTPFDLKLPNDEIMQAKVCQDNSKALMSRKNKDLGKWILRDVLELKEGEVLTYDKLQTIDVDSVVIEKIGDLSFRIDFKERGAFEKFEEENKNSSN